jgi:hypothetical protein
MTNTPHRDLFEKYVAALSWAVNEARTLREQDFANLREEYEGDRARANEAFEGYGELHADPYVIGAVREYWLACDSLNRAEHPNAVAPETFILAWLRDAQPDLADLVSGYPYWPIGQDDKGAWL